mgnify:CR=1 FL=1
MAFNFKKELLHKELLNQVNSTLLNFFFILQHHIPDINFEFI